MSSAIANSGGITGRHGNTLTCLSCHNAGAFTATAVISASSVTHNALSATFTLTGTGGTRRGFNLAIYNPSNVKVNGGFSSLSGGVQALSGELTHTAPQNLTTSWTFRWTAPATLGTYTAYACVNPVNNNTFSTGDGNAACSTTAFSVTNNIPNAINDSKTNIAALSVFENSTTGTFNALSNDLQTDGDAFSWFATNQAGLTGALTDNSNGTFNYNPNGQFESLDTGETTTTNFTYSIRENSYLTFTDTATVTIEIKGSNDAPIAANDGSLGLGSGHVTINEGATAVNVGNLLLNDNDVDVETITASRAGPGCGAVSPTETTSFTLNSNGTFNYMHNGNEPVQDSFSYCAFDGDAYSAVVTVYVDIAAQNDAPVISTSLGNTAFTEQTAVIVDSNVSLSDIDSTLFNLAQIDITGSYVPGEDTLTCTTSLPFNGISSCSFSSGLLTISGTALIADYETVIEGVQFNSSSDNPDLTSKTVSFNVRDDALATSSNALKTITISRLNDPPTLAAITNQVTLENTAADPNTFTYTAVGSDPDIDDDINDGMGSLTYSLLGQPGGMIISNTAPTHGQISWMPPQTGTFNLVYGPITVAIEDGNEDVSTPNSVSFSITVSPPDNDSDGLANYNDLCLNFADATNADNDGDGTPGTDGADANSGGDVCDADDDNDGMPDTFETANGLDPFDPADAPLDPDNDGFTNLDEFLNGTNPNIGDQTIDATGYWTPFTLTPPNPTVIDPLATAVVASDYGPYRPGNNIITWTASNAVSSNLGTGDQTLDIRPILNFVADQVTSVSNTVSVTATLNGDPPVSPVSVNYLVSGTANSSDHDATNGSFTITSPALSTSFSFNVFNVPMPEVDETVIFTINSATNAAIGSNSVHTVTIASQNVAPSVDLQIRQIGQTVGSAYVSAGIVDILATITDPDTGQMHSLDWSGTDNSLVPPTDSVTANWSLPIPPVVGNYLIDLVVTDDGFPVRSTRVSRLLNIQATAPVLLITDDSDNDGIDDLAEGFGDSDNDGIPDYLDPVTLDINLMPNQTGDPTTAFLIETEPGLKISLGSTTQASGNFDLQVTDSQVKNFGSSTGGAPLNADDGFEHVGGVHDFEISGVTPGASARIVIPLQSSIPNSAVYRKFDDASGWKTFVTNSQNRVASATGELGACPEPGSSKYRSGLNFLDNCVQLTIQDGGSNDTDNIVNGVIKDPGTVALNLNDPVDPTVEGSGRMNVLFLFWLLVLAGFGFLIKTRKRT